MSAHDAYVTSLLSKYSLYYNVPVLTPGWPKIAQYAAARITGFTTYVSAPITLTAGVSTVFTPSLRP